MKRLIVIFFSISLISLIGLFLNRQKSLFAAQEASPTAKIIVPTSTPDIYTGAPAEFLYPGMLPDHFFYFMKDLYYRFRTKLVFGLTQQADWYLKLADKRAAEARELAKRGKQELASQAIQKAIKMQAAAGEKMGKLGKEADQELVEKLKKVNLRQRVTLEGLLERVSPEAKVTIGELLERSKKGLVDIFASIGASLPEEATPAAVLTGTPAEKISDPLLTQIKANPQKSYEIQVRLTESVSAEKKKELEKLMDVEAYTERQAVGKAKGEKILKVAELAFVNKIIFLPKAVKP